VEAGTLEVDVGPEDVVVAADPNEKNTVKKASRAGENIIMAFTEQAITISTTRNGDSID